MRTIKKAVKRNLAREKAARFRFLVRVINFALSITAERGRTLPRTIHDSIRTVRELCNFGGFSFYVDLGYCMVGENILRVWYQPDPKGDGASLPVLELYWYDNIDKCDVRRFDTRRLWEPELLRVIRCRGRIGNNLDREHVELMRRKELERRRAAQREHMTRDDRFRRKARRDASRANAQ